MKNMLGQAHDRIAELEGEVARLFEQIECRDQRKMYVWTDRFSYLAVAHAKSVSKARDLLLSNDCIGESGDGSCPERDKARKTVLSTNPCIWLGENAEFALTDSAELKEQEQHSARLEERASKAEAERDTLLASVATLREALEELKAEYEGAGMNDDERKTTYIWSLTRIDTALTNPATTEALERVRRDAKAEAIDAIRKEADELRTLSGKGSLRARLLALVVDELLANAAELRGGE